MSMSTSNTTVAFLFSGSGGEASLLGGRGWNESAPVIVCSNSLTFERRGRYGPVSNVMTSMDSVVQEEGNREGGSGG